MRYVVALAFSVMLSACAGAARPVANLPSGAAAYSVIPATPATDNTTSDYLIGPLDTIDVTVFEEPDLSIKATQVDASGNIALPLVGTVAAQGKTAADLSKELEDLFGAKYLQESTGYGNRRRFGVAEGLRSGRSDPARHLPADRADDAARRHLNGEGRDGSGEAPGGRCLP